jgi:hypothetical protein
MILTLVIIYLISLWFNVWLLWDGFFSRQRWKDYDTWSVVKAVFFVTMPLINTLSILAMIVLWCHLSSLRK